MYFIQMVMKVVGNAFIFKLVFLDVLNEEIYGLVLMGMSWIGILLETMIEGFWNGMLILDLLPDFMLLSFVRGRKLRKDGCRDNCVILKLSSMDLRRNIICRRHAFWGVIC